MDLSAFDLKGKVALITGGAHGIGFSIAEGMAKCGATICFNCSSEASLEKGMAAYKAAGIDAHGYAADVSDEDAVNAMVAKIKAEVGPVDILVNNAGLMKRVPMVEMSHADFMRVIDVHVGGAFNCSKAVLPDMMEKHEGKIINICSMMSELGRETVSAYAAAKVLDATEGDPSEAASLAKAFPKCAFGVLAAPEALTPDRVAQLAECLNVVVLPLLQSPELPPGSAARCS